MSNQEILHKAIAKALKNGFPADGLDSATDFFKSYGYIFNHDFAKSLWGGENWEHQIEYTMKIGRRTETIVAQPWLYHLQMMVIADDPITYLGANL